VNESDDRTADTPRQRSGLLGLLRRLFGGGRASAPSVQASPIAPSTASSAEPGVSAATTEAIPADVVAASVADGPRWQRPDSAPPADATPARPAAWEGPLLRREGEQPQSAQPVSPDPWENPAVEQSAEAAVAPPPVDTAPPPVSPVPEPPGAAEEEGTRPRETKGESETVESVLAPAAEPDLPADSEQPAAAARDEQTEHVAEASPQPIAASEAPVEPEAAAATGEAKAPAEHLPAGPSEAVAPVRESARVTSTPPAEPEPVHEVALVDESVAAEPAPGEEPVRAEVAGPVQQPASAAEARPLTSPLDRARAALEEARRQMPGLMAEAAPAAQATAQPAGQAPAEGSAARAYAAEWPGLLEGLRQAREGLAGEINVLRSVVNDLRREVGRLSDVVAGMQRGEGVQPQQTAGLQQTLPRLQAMLDQLRTVSGTMEGHAQQPLMSASGAPLTPPVRVQVPRPNGTPPTLPEIVWSTPVPHEHVFVPQPEAATQATQAQQPAAPHAHGPALLLVIAPVEGLTKLSALERRLAGSDAVQRLDLGGYRRGEASFRLVLAAGASIHDVIRVAPEPGSTVADVRIEGNLARVQLSPREAAQPASSPS
jgi:hypothetical protein